MVQKINTLIRSLNDDKYLEITFDDMSVFSAGQDIPDFNYSQFKILISVFINQIRFTVKLDNYVYVDYGTNIENLEYTEDEIIISKLIHQKRPYLTCSKIIISNKDITFTQHYFNKDSKNPFDYRTITLCLTDYVSLNVINSSVDNYIDYSVKPNSSTQTKACYIATLAYQDIDHPNVEYLRQLRDKYLNKTFIGRRFISFYYTHSPYLAEKLKRYKLINNIIKSFLDIFIFLSSNTLKK